MRKKHPKVSISQRQPVCLTRSFLGAKSSSSHSEAEGGSVAELEAFIMRGSPSVTLLLLFESNMVYLDFVDLVDMCSLVESILLLTIISFIYL